MNFNLKTTEYFNLINAYNQINTVDKIKDRPPKYESLILMSIKIREDDSTFHFLTLPWKYLIM